MSEQPPFVDGDEMFASNIFPFRPAPMGKLSNPKLIEANAKASARIQGLKAQFTRRDTVRLHVPETPHRNATIYIIDRALTAEIPIAEQPHYMPDEENNKEN